MPWSVLKAKMLEWMLGAFVGQLILVLYKFSFSMLKDERVKQVHKRSVFETLDDDDLTDRIG